MYGSSYNGVKKKKCGRVGERGRGDCSMCFLMLEQQQLVSVRGLNAMIENCWVVVVFFLATTPLPPCVNDVW